LLSSISVVIPAYNEEKRLPASLEQVSEYLRGKGGIAAEILVINDGSRDATRDLSQALARRLEGNGLDIRVLDNPGNRGKGYSVRHGMLEARHDWVLFTDADLSAPIEECDRLIDAVDGGQYDVAIGSRALDRSLIGVHQSGFRESMGRFFNLMVRLGAGLSLHDTQCGFKLFSRQAVQAIFPSQQVERFGFDVEILYLAQKFGLRVAEVPVRWNHCEGTTVGMLSGADAFLDVWRVRRNDWLGKYNHHRPLPSDDETTPD
jgi:glycosyltransferase involved in cell wall biosynthesis